jgi:polysaccharide pyruvyl transferase WcaK-like protein
LKFVVTGPLADKNLGDYAMFINNIYDLGKSHEFSIFHYSGEFVKQLENDYLSGYDCNFTEVEFNKSFYTKPSFINRLLRKALSMVDIKIPHEVKIPVSSEILSRVNDLDEIETLISSSDALIVSGGGYFNKLWFEWARRDDLFKILVPILVAKKHNKKIYFTANGFGPFDESDKYFCDFFGLIPDAFLGVRDKVLSKVYLKRLGVSDKNIVDIPDDLFILNKQLAAKKSHIDKLCDDDYIVLEFYYGLDWVKNNTDLIKAFVDDVWNKYQCRVVYMPFDLTPVSQYIKDNFTSQGVKVIDGDDYLKIEDAVSIIKNAKAVLCNRYHALVLSLQNQVPVINIMKEVYDYRYYYNKNSGILRNTFEGTDFNENEFLKIGAEETFVWFANNLEEVIKQQMNLYSSSCYKENKIKLASDRNDYFNVIQSSDKL